MQMENLNTTSGRLISLDVFRGLTIAGMIIVNDPGSWSHVYPPLLHAPWHGITPTDMVFPFFVFIVGVSITLAYTKRMAQGIDRKKVITKILRRSLIIFALGLFLALFPRFNFANIRIPGVLQRIALVFLACSLLFINTNWKTQARVGAGLLIGYWLLMCFVPTPGLGKVLLEPGQNLAAWVDSLLIPGRLWQGTWDPEGLLSTLPAIATGITGMLTGHLLVSKLSQDRKLIWLFSLGFLAFVVGSIWNWVFPINKNLWTSSYVLYTSGLAALTLAASIWFVDMKGYTKWTKVGIIFGANAITAYVLHGILNRFLFFPSASADAVNGIFYKGIYLKTIFFEGLVSTGMEPKLASLLWALFYTFLVFIPVWVLYRRKIFIKI